MYDTLGHPFMIKMIHFLQKVKVFDERRAAGSGFQRVVVVFDANSFFCGQILTFCNGRLRVSRSQGRLALISISRTGYLCRQSSEQKA
jgi:hypothetical protein